MLKPREYAYALTIGAMVAFGAVRDCESQEKIQTPKRTEKEQRVLPTRTDVDDEKEKFRRVLTVGCGSRSYETGDYERDDQFDSKYLGFTSDTDLSCRDELLSFLEDKDDASEADYESCVVGLNSDETRAIDRFWNERLLMDTIVPRNRPYSDYVGSYNAALFDLKGEQEAEQYLEIYDGQTPRPTIVNEEGDLIDGPSIKGSFDDVNFTILVQLEEDGTTNFTVDGMSTNGMCFAEGDDPVSTVWNLVEACDSIESGY